jgi:hypothetical protein
MAELKTINGGDLAGFQYYDMGQDTNGQTRRVLAFALVDSGGADTATTAAKQDTANTSLASIAGSKVLKNLGLVATALTYQDGDCIGGLLTVTNALRTGATTGTLESIVVLDRQTGHRLRLGNCIHGCCTKA